MGLEIYSTFGLIILATAFRALSRRCGAVGISDLRISV